MLKRLIKRLFCRHDFYRYGEVRWSCSAGGLPEIRETVCRCAKCGKEKSLKYKMPWYMEEN